jgi:hypothetical protein
MSVQSVHAPGVEMFAGFTGDTLHIKSAAQS